MRLLERLQSSIHRRQGEVVLRSELSRLGGRTQLSEALKAMVRDGKLIRLGSGVYAKSRQDAHGIVRLAGEREAIIEEMFRKLGRKVEIVPAGMDGESALHVVLAPGVRVARKLTIEDAQVHIASANAAAGGGRDAQLGADLDLLPTAGVSEFVEKLAQAHHVVFERTRLDDWSEAVTRAAGDDVRLDRTEKLLVALKKKNVIGGRQAARLLTNHMRETRRVRSVPGLRK